MEKICDIEFSEELANLILLEKEQLSCISEHLILHSSFMPGLGLFNGKMGSVLFFFHYAQYTKNTIYEDFAGELLDEIYQDLDGKTPISFSDGLCGIGWAIEYLEQQKFVEYESNDILVDLDQKIMERDLRRIEDYSFETGLEGILYYVVNRRLISSDKGAYDSFDDLYLADLTSSCKRAGFNCGDKSYFLWQQTLTKILDLSENMGHILTWREGMKLLLK